VLGVVNLHSISILNPAYDVSEGMVRIGDIGNAAKARGGGSLEDIYNLKALVL